MKKIKYDQASAWSVLQKLRVFMKLWFFLLTPLGILLASPAKTQTLTMELKNVPLRQALLQVEKKSGYSFFYNDSFADLDKPISIQVQNESIKNVLEILLTPTNLSYKFMDGKLIVIAPKSLITPKSSLEKVTIKGVVTGASDKQPLPAVTVSIKGQPKGTTTNANGEYTIEAETGQTLVFSFIGYNTQEVLIGNKTKIDIALEATTTLLNEVTVVSTGYQDIEKRLFTGSVVKLDGAEVKTAGTTDVGRMLQGRAAGVSVQNVSGTFGAAPKIRVRGATSINGDNKPLWVIDGVILEDVVNVSTEQLTTGDASTLIGSSVAGLNSDDIESISILKDASATALYGARAKDGVIVIKTKKGQTGKPQFTYTGNFSTYLKPTYNSFNIMNSVDQMSVYAEMERKGLLNHSDLSKIPNGGVYKKMYDIINQNYDETTGEYELINDDASRRKFLQRYALANTDWFDVLFKNSFVQEHSLGFSSGTEAAQFYFSGSYYDDKGWTIADKVKRYTANARGVFKLNDKLTIGIITSGSVRDQHAPGTVTRLANMVEGSYDRDFDINPFSYAINTSRVLTPYNQKGQLEYFTRNYAPFNIINEINQNYIDLNQLDMRIQGELGYKLGKGVKYDFLGAVRYVKNTTEHKVEENSNMAEAYRANGSQSIRIGNKFLYYNPDYPNLDPVIVLPQGGFYNRTDDQMVSYYFKNQFSWSYVFNTLHTINMVAGQEIRQVDRQNSFNNGYGYQYGKGGVAYTDYLAIKQLLEGNFNYYGMSNTYDRYASFYAGGTYSFKEKYIANGTIRMDGSNKLGASKNARWLPTWNISGAWNLDTEDFLHDLTAINVLTLKAGYGLTANAGNATNSSVVYRSGTTRRPYLNETESQIGIESLENSDLTWEKQYETNIGLNLGLFNRLTITADYYRRRQFDLIGVIKTSGIGGEAYKAVNYADMKSHGVDLSVGGTVLKGSHWSWNSTFIFSQNKNKITDLKNQPRIIDLVFPDGGAKEGYPVRSLFSVDFKGLDPNSGIPLFTDHTGEKSSNVYLQSTSTQYLKYEGPIDPPITGGFSNIFTYKNLTLNVFLAYQTGNKIRLNPAFKSYYTDLDATPKEFNDRWLVPGDEQVTPIPSILDAVTLQQLGAVYPYNTYNYSTARTADGTFIRLRTVSLMYTLPERLLRGFSIKNASLGITGTNLLLLYSDKKLYGQDPEFFASGGVALPVAKQITATLKLSF
ncbi:SusC/RagA family TonB-linked outer membrane protein [Cytophagaceae bacterium YF14B1]|uniref:SusC/RagA family TonB-linked outer membrane protein n=1 Tax=Xanthocytophaga flava TaxID=3048013 RepID=A0AAE3UCZ8_9BACT|nr:SusC/RagA family TonB-linked outer membrane protein [Xanthocytophaga flavus]MDJ1486033.1 SusC/RagA family TonB-linked outer membrane protein [Xanthocytophaga flavus]